MRFMCSIDRQVNVFTKLINEFYRPGGSKNVYLKKIN